MSGVSVDQALQVLLVVVVVLPALTAAALTALTLGGRAIPHAGRVGVLALALAALASWPVVASNARVATPFVVGADLGLAATGPAVVLLPTMLVVAALVLVVASTEPETREPRFVSLMLLFTSAAALTVLATSLPTLLLGWELMGAMSYALIGYRYRDPRRVSSGATAFLTTRAADLGLYLATAAALAGGTDLSLDALAGADPGWRDVVAAGVLVAALGKAAQLPFSFWLDRAMDGPSPASALLHSAAMVALGGYLLIRLSPLLDATTWAGTTAAWVGVTTAVVLGAVAVVQTDLKRLLAASTAAQLGFVVLAAGVGSTAAGASHLVAHAAVKSLLFLAAGAWLEALGTKRLSALSGVARRWPALGAVAVAGLLALSGLPPLSLWVTKDAILAGAHEESLALYLMALVGSLLAVVYAMVALVAITRTPPLGDMSIDAALDEERRGTRTVSRRVPLSLAPLALGAAGLGILAAPPVLDRLPGAVTAEPSALDLLLTSLMVVVTAVLAVAWQRSGGSYSPVVTAPVRVLRDWLGLERAVHRVVVRPCLRAAELAARIDDRVIAAGATGAARGALRIARSLAGLDQQVLSRGVSSTARRTVQLAGRAATGEAALARLVTQVGATARSGGRVVRRTSSSGQLHQYYLQLVGAVLVVLAVVSVVVLVESSR